MMDESGRRVSHFIKKIIMRDLDTNGATVIDMHEAERLIRESGGAFFRVDFVKRTNRTLRQMVARIGVPPTHPRGGKPYDAKSHGLLTVWEPMSAGFGTDRTKRDHGFRCIGIEGIRALRICRKTFLVEK
jgi:hypothetical protein